MKRTLIAALGLLAALAAPAAADVITYNVTGTLDTDKPVSATATFTTSADQIVVELTNLQENPTSVIQALSDLIFTLSDTPTDASLTSSSAQEVTIDSDGNPTFGGVVDTGWLLFLSDSTITLDVLAGGAAGPAHLIIGPPDSFGVYSNANASIAGNDPHNPFLNQTATFIISAPGVTSSTTVTSVFFSFGTTPGVELPGEPGFPPVPEPSTLLLIGAGLLGVGTLRRLRR